VCKWRRTLARAQCCSRERLRVVGGDKALGVSPVCARARAHVHARGRERGRGREGEREKFYVKTTVKCARSRRTRGVALHRACTCQPFRRISTRSPLYHPLHPRLRVRSDFFRVSDRICANDDAMISRPVARARYSPRARFVRHRLARRSFRSDRSREIEYRANDTESRRSMG